MLHELSGHSDVEISVAWAHRGCNALRSFTEGGFKYYVFPEPGRFVRGGGVLRKFNDQVEHIFRSSFNRRAVAESVAVVEEYGPDLVQVFGTEHQIGLIAPFIQPPLVVWIQGILDVYRHSYFGGMGCWERMIHPKMLWDFYRMTVNARREREIFRRCQYFMGRTGWDATHQSRLQPQGHYFRVQECIRPEFRETAPWQIEEARVPTIYTTTSANLWKGTEILIRAIKLLSPSCPDIRLRVAGALHGRDPVARRLFAIVRRLKLKEKVEFLGQLDSAQIVDELKKARVFVLPSFIENSPNSLAEAQLVGTPSVASFAGGVADMIINGETGLLYPAGDAAALARQIECILTDDELAVRLSVNSRRASQKRHAPAAITDDLLKAYAEILKSNAARIAGLSVPIGRLTTEADG